jgi:hypothetical protein
MPIMTEIWNMEGEEKGVLCYDMVRSAFVLSGFVKTILSL